VCVALCEALTFGLFHMFNCASALEYHDEENCCMLMLILS